MKLEVDCTWNEKRHRAKLVICFDYCPKSLFSMPNEIISRVQKLSQSAANSGPPVLEELKLLHQRYAKSPYLAFIYWQTLEFFQYDDEADQLLAQLARRFPEQPLTKCALANQLIKDKKYQAFASVFNHIEVLKGAFPKRRFFFFEEALCFHHLWGRYSFETGNEVQCEKHKKFLFLIMNTLKSLDMVY